MVGFDSPAAAKTRRCKNESGLQEGESLPAPALRVTGFVPAGLLSHGLPEGWHWLCSSGRGTQGLA